MGRWSSTGGVNPRRRLLPQLYEKTLGRSRALLTGHSAAAILSVTVCLVLTDGGVQTGRSFHGVVRGGAVVLDQETRLPDGMAVLVLPRLDGEESWHTVGEAAEITGAAPTRICEWVRSAKVRVHSEAPDLVNLGGVEDAHEQDMLLSLSLEVVARDDP